MIDPGSAYLTRQLIAYIGNKRRLLPSLLKLFTRLNERRHISEMLDPFAGSGSVSRLGKAMGFRVYSNDWEEYSRIINSCHLLVSPQKAKKLFLRYGGLQECLKRLNSLDNVPSEQYFSRFFAPRDTALADYRSERLFYTRENAFFLDRVRSWIEEEYPESICSGDDDKKAEKEILIAMLLYEAATHANTSGVFKACHKGFGGHGGDSLGRIMAPMGLEYPVLLDGPEGGVGSEDARQWSAGRTVDLCYLDPPYNIHQYGSNYHLLNSVALWDRKDASLELDQSGRLKNKAGIRGDWQETRSPYCSRTTAPGALKDLLNAIDAGCLVLSYNSEGIIAFEELMDILTATGRVELFAENYIQYRGGKQGLNRKNLTTEFQLVVTRGEEHRQTDTVAVNRYLQLREAGMLLKHGFHPQRLKERQRYLHGSLKIDKEGNTVVPLFGGCLPDPKYVSPDIYSFLKEHDLSSLREDLMHCLFRDNSEEAEILLYQAAREKDPRIVRILFQRFLIVLKKLAHKKYREIFWTVYTAALDWVENEITEKPAYLIKLEKIRDLADKRFAG